MSYSTTQEIIRTEEVIEALSLQKMGRPGRWIAQGAMRMLYLQNFNDLYARMGLGLQGPALMQRALDACQIGVDCQGLEHIPPHGPFLTISNHPSGLLDGIAIVALLGRIRPEYKVTANFLLKKLGPLSDCFVAVNPFEGGKRLGARAQVEQMLSEGGCVGIFPAGEVSTYQAGQEGITDRPWSLSAMKLIQEAGVPVIPVYFGAENSRLFHAMGRIHPLLRTASLAREFFNKQGKTIPVRIGEPIQPYELSGKSVEELQTWLRTQVYALKKGMPICV